MKKDVKKLLRDRRILLLIIILAAAFILVAVRGIHFGIEFSGGTRIPLSLERPVDQYTMMEMMGNIKNRVSAFGLQQVLVKAIGESEIYVELPKSDPTLIEKTIELLKKQGRFEGVVDGRVALSGRDIMPGSIGISAPMIQGNRVGWEVRFAITESAAIHFAEVVKGKADYPVYMFLDRPENSVILISKDEVIGNSSLTEDEAMPLLRDVLRKDNESLPLVLFTEPNSTENELAGLKDRGYTKLIASDYIDEEFRRRMNETLGFELVNVSSRDMTPQYIIGRERVIVSEWKAVGLLSAPTLREDITKGTISRLYSISGEAPLTLPPDERRKYAIEEAKSLKSILTGGALPVKVIIGTPTTIPAPLGAEFLKYSIVGALLAIIVVVLIATIRYGDIRISVPILITVSCEATLLICLLGGLGTIDLGTMAGIVGAIGTGVDAQIVITDEMFSHFAGATVKKKLNRAFHIIVINATTAVIAMLPLLFFSGLVEIIGFALSIIFGMFIGALVTRPAYGAMLEFLIKD